MAEVKRGRICVGYQRELDRLRAEQTAKQKGGKADPAQPVGQGDRHNRSTAAKRATAAGTNRQYIDTAALRRQYIDVVRIRAVNPATARRELDRLQSERCLRTTWASIECACKQGRFRATARRNCDVPLGTVRWQSGGIAP